MKATTKSFSQVVYDLTKQIPKGKVTTYGILANISGRPKASRAVGTILGANPHPIVVPCHRVVRSDGTLGGYSGDGGIKTKFELLVHEGVEIRNGSVDLSKFLFTDFKVKP